MGLTIQRMKTALLALHFQNDLTHEKGKMAPFGVPAHVKQTNCLAKAKKAIDSSRRVGVPVIHVVAVFREGYPEIPEIVPLAPLFSGIKRVGAFMEATWGAEICEEVKAELGDIIIKAPQTSAFYASELDCILRNKGITTIVLSGIATNMGVESTARVACDAAYEVIILRDCCASFNEEIHSFTLDNVLPRLATISNSEEYLKALSKIM